MKDDNIIKFGIKKEAKRKEGEAQGKSKASGRREADKDKFDIMVEYEEQVDELKKENIKLKEEKDSLSPSKWQHSLYFSSLAIGFSLALTLYILMALTK